MTTSEKAYTPENDLQLIEQTRQEMMDVVESKNKTNKILKIDELGGKVIGDIFRKVYGIGSDDVDSNPPFYTVLHGGLKISIMDQQIRLFTTMADENCEDLFSLASQYGDLEKGMYQSSNMLHYIHEFQRKYNFRKAILYGSHIDTTRNIIALADLPLDDILALQGEKSYFSFKGLLDPEKLSSFLAQSRQECLGMYDRLKQSRIQILGQ